MRMLILVILLLIPAVIAGFYFASRPVRCEDCNQGKKCTTSFECGEIEVCYCQHTFEEENGLGTCYFE
jgi:hypothetical protein